MDEYITILTDCPLEILKLDRLEDWRHSKLHPEMFKMIRSSNPGIFDITTLGVRIILNKAVSSEYLYLRPY